LSNQIDIQSETGATQAARILSGSASRALFGTTSNGIAGSGLR
jgi:mevalonate pyrophosphate decarboxylase